MITIDRRACWSGYSVLSWCGVYDELIWQRCDDGLREPYALWRYEATWFLTVGRADVRLK